MLSTSSSITNRNSSFNLVYCASVTSHSNTEFATHLSIEEIIHIFVKDMSFCSQTIIFPLLFYMYQSPLSGTKAEMLNPRRHEYIIVIIHLRLYKFFYNNASRKVGFVNSYCIIRELTWSIICLFLDLDKIK